MSINKRTNGKDFIGVGVGGVIINNNNEILLLLRNVFPEKNLWSIPGGMVEFGEEIETALIREIEEELGAKVAIVQLLCVTNHILQSKKTHWVSPAFLVKIISGNPLNRENKKHLDMKWFSLDKLPDNLAIPAISAINSYNKLYPLSPIVG